MILAHPYEKFLRKLFSGGLKAQSFLLAGSGAGRERAEELLVKFLTCKTRDFCKRCESCALELNPDLYVYEGALLKLEEAKEIERKAHQSAWRDSKIFLIKTDFIGWEAQAAFLKTIEEPNPDTYFIISISSENALSLPLASRLTAFHLAPSKPDLDSATRKKFISGGAGQELLNAAVFAKDRTRLEEALEAFEFWAEEKIRQAPASQLKTLAVFLEDLFEIKSRFYAKTYFNRMLLEHLIISRLYLDS
ncbi:MAG: hypothetical protein Q8R12_02960 [bacterium]|nr:hypothetical protein [bacterium]